VIAALLALAVAYALASAYLHHRQRELIFFPVRDVLSTPADASVRYEDVRIPVEGTQAVHGWWLRADSDAAPILLYLHGNDGNVGTNVERIAHLRRLGHGVLAIDYRGYGRSSEGSPSEASLYADADAAWRYLVAELHADPRRTFVYGHSLGGAVAVELAARHPGCAGVIVESGFTSLADMARIDYWMFPTGWLLHQRFDALSRLRDVRVPILLIHGTADREVPFAMSERLYAAARAPKAIALVPGAGHEDVGTIGEERYGAALCAFTGACQGVR
jgi:fermentation-respiration switch protein FrsA (DUF1100 family)